MRVSVESGIWVGFALLLAIGAMLSLCWAILGLSWGFVGSFGTLLAASGRKILNPNRSMVWLRLQFVSISSLCWAIWRHFVVPS